MYLLCKSVCESLEWMEVVRLHVIDRSRCIFCKFTPSSFECTLVNVYVDLLVFTRIAGTS